MLWKFLFICFLCLPLGLKAERRRPQRRGDDFYSDEELETTTPMVVEPLEPIGPLNPGPLGPIDTDEPLKEGNPTETEIEGNDNIGIDENPVDTGSEDQRATSQTVTFHKPDDAKVQEPKIFKPEDPKPPEAETTDNSPNPWDPAPEEPQPRIQIEPDEETIDPFEPLDPMVVGSKSKKSSEVYVFGDGGKIQPLSREESKEAEAEKKEEKIEDPDSSKILVDNETTKKECSIHEARQQCERFRDAACPLSGLLFALQPLVYSQCLAGCGTGAEKCRAFEVIAATCLADPNKLRTIMVEFGC